MEKCPKTNSNDCLFINDDAACLPSFRKLFLVLQKSKPSEKQKQKSQLWNYKSEIISFSLQEDGDLHVIFNSLYIYIINLRSKKL